MNTKRLLETGKKGMAAGLSAAVIITALGPGFSRAFADGPVGIEGSAGAARGGLYAPVDPAILTAFNRFSIGSALDGMNISPIAAGLGASHFLDRVQQLRELQNAGKMEQARALRAQLESEILSSRDAASAEVTQRLSSSLSSIADVSDPAEREERVLALERETRGLEPYATKDAGLSAALNAVWISASSIRENRLSTDVAAQAQKLAPRTPGSLPQQHPVVNDVTQLNPIVVDRVETPKTIEEIAALVKSHPGPVSIGGGRYSQGGQTATEGALQIDMRQYNKVLDFQPQAKTITVQTGARWRDLQHFLDPHGLAVKIMQTYADFTVGGAMSVNCHGRYIGLGPVVFSIDSIKVVLADGSIVKASPTENSEIFYGSIGGYGGLGVIAEATLQVADNMPVERSDKLMPMSEYKDWFKQNIRDNPKVVFHNADMYKPYEQVRAVTWSLTDKPVTVKEHFTPATKSYWLDRLVIYLMMDRPWGMLYRRIADYFAYLNKHPAVYRNHEASYDVRELEPHSRKTSTYVLQEYFVPIEKFDEFQGKMAEVFERYGVNMMNVSVRHAKQDPGTLLAWARNEVFAFVLYYKQGVTDADKDVVATWTRELIDQVLAVGGAYYLPYQIHATTEQFLKAYPRAPEYFALKAKLDPSDKFRNKLWDAYYPGERAEAAGPSALDRASNFRTVYGKTGLKDGFFRFLQSIYHLYPEGKFHQAIAEETAKATTDEDIYKGVQARLPGIKPFLSQLFFGLPSLWKQKAEMAKQTAQILGPQANPINGYVEIGTTGRYVDPLKKLLPMKGPVYLLPLWTKSDYSVMNIAERGQLRKVGKDIPNMYDPISAADIPDESVDLVTVYIGLHHSPLSKLDPFVRSLWRILRPGGKLVLRDHDVRDSDMDHFVGLAHDVYNDGLGMPWEENKKELRHFTAVAQESAYLAARGFKDSGQRILQANDPTKNTLMEYTKVGTNYGTEHRGEDNTFLTLPEWYIVFSARDYAQAMKGKPSGFPYFQETAQYWQDYAKVLGLVRGKYPANVGYNAMLAFIGISFSAENIIKAVYENTVGRLFEIVGQRTPEDDYAQKVAQEYADFVNLRPWYEFPYAEKLKGLWRIPLTGPNMLRKLERRAFLSMEYGVKTGYAWVTNKLTQAAYAPEEFTTVARMSAMPDSVLKAEPRIKVLHTFEDGSVEVSLPRYGPFTDIVPMLAKEGLSFQSVAGNETLFMTVLAPRDFTPAPSMGETVFESPIPVNAGQKRIAIRVPVTQLSTALNALQAGGATIEHVYDY